MEIHKLANIKLLEESFTLPPDFGGGDGDGIGYPLYVTAKRYHVKELKVAQGDLDAVTLIALHSTSFHKESWEPTLEAMFEAMVTNGLGKVKIRDVWAVDCPNHGHAGSLNREVLKRKEFATDFGCQRYAEAIHRFLMSAPRSFGVDLSKRKLVGLGHSLGANALLLLQGLQPIFPFISLIIVEPMVSPGGGHHLDRLRTQLVDRARRRTFEWPDRETAFLSLNSNPRLAKWDKRVLKAFVDHALTESPSGVVSLACTPQQEQAMYLDIPGATRPVEELTRLCRILPIHLILGLKHDLVPRTVHEGLLDPTSGRTYFSVHEIPEIPQETPNKLGALVYELLTLVMERLAKL